MRPRNLAAEEGEIIVLLLILLAILGGGFWYLWSSKRANENAARDFAGEVTERIVLRGDQRFLDLRLSPEAQTAYPPSWRERLFAHLRELGTPSTTLDVHGQTTFTSHFFDPHGHFRVRIVYPENPAYLDLEVSHPRALWQIDTINLIWTPSSPIPTPSPTAAPTIDLTPNK